jgi:hypothetical protein
MRSFDFVTLLAAGNVGNMALGLKLLIFIGVSVVLAILRKVAENREQTIRANTANKTPPVPAAKKDNPFRNEIEAFLEEVGKRRTGNERLARPPGERGANDTVVTRPIPASKPEAARKPVTLRPVASGDRAKVEPIKTIVVAPGLAGRPGDEIAARKAPGSDDLGKQIRQHLSSYLDSTRMAAQTQSDLGNSVERTVHQHLGATARAVLAEQQQSAAPPPEASLIVPFLQDPSNVRRAILANEILGPPRGLRRRR